MQAMRASFTNNFIWCEKCAFQQDIPGVIRNCRTFTAHNTRQGKCLIIITDNQIIRIKRDFLAIQQGQFFTCRRHANSDAALNLTQVKSMHRLTQLNHDIIGNINQWTDRAAAATTQLFLHPQRGFCFGIDIFDDSAGIARTGFFGFNMDIDCIVNCGDLFRDFN